MFNQLYENIVLRERIEKKLRSLLEGKTWEQIALALYQIIDDISTADDMCKENAVAFRNMVMKLQAKKNQLLYSPDGQTVKRVDEAERRGGISWPRPGFSPRGDKKYEVVILTKPDGDKKTIYAYADSRKDLDRDFKEQDTTVISVKEIEEHLNDAGSGDTDDIDDVRPTGKNKKSRPPKKKKLTPEEWKKQYSDPVRYGGKESRLKENLTDYARNELQIAGLFDKDSDYDGMLGEATIELINTFAKQGHSGFSASLVRELFSKLSNYKPLTEISNNPEEWMDVHEYCSDGPDMWQSKRCPSLFSGDGGKTYWDIDEDYYFHTDENGDRWSGGLSEEEWKNRPMHTSEDYKFIESIKYGLMAIDESGNILHFCGYVNKPTEKDEESLCNELKVDTSFGLTDRDDWEIVPTPQEVVDYNIEKMSDEQKKT